jgi:hypothetical protein
VVAIAKTASATGERPQTGSTLPADATRTTITGLDPAETYSVEVRSAAGPRMSEAFPVSDVAPATAPTRDTTLPTMSFMPKPEPTGVTTATSVTLQSDGQIFYTTGSANVIAGDTPADGAKVYSGAIPITQETTIRAAAFDRAGNHRELTATFAPPAGPTAAPTSAPGNFSATAGELSAGLKWAAGDASITGYRVAMYDTATATIPAKTQDTATTSLTVTGLSASKDYWFTVSQKNASEKYGPETSRVKATPVGDRVTVTTAKWKAGDFRVTGSGSVTGATVTVRRVNADGSIGAVITGATGTVVAPVAPATVGSYDIRVRAGAPAANPGRIIVTSDKGGTTTVFTVS